MWRGWLQGAGAPLDHYLIPPTYIGIIDSIVQLRDNRTTEEEIHKILSRTVRACVHAPQPGAPDWPISGGSRAE